MHRNVADYYSFGGREVVEQVYANVLRTPTAIRETVDAMADVGVEEVCLWPMTPEPRQIAALAGVLDLPR